MKRILSLILVIFSVLLFVSCDSSDYKNNDYPGAAEGGYENENVDLSSTASNDRKIIITAEYTVECLDFTQIAADLNEITAQLGGYSESSRVSQNSATLVLKIPSSEYEGFGTRLSGMGTVVSHVQSGRDVTLEYIDIEAKIDALKAERARITALMQEAKNVNEVIEVSKRLTEIQKELDSLESRLNYLKNATDYATVTVYLRQKAGHEKDNVPFGEQIKEAWVVMGKTFVKVCQFFTLALIYMLPYIVLLVVVVLVIIYISKRRKNKK